MLPSTDNKMSPAIKSIFQPETNLQTKTNEHFLITFSYFTLENK